MVGEGMPLKNRKRGGRLITKGKKKPTGLRPSEPRHTEENQKIRGKEGKRIFASAREEDRSKKRRKGRLGKKGGAFRLKT